MDLRQPETLNNKGKDASLLKSRDDNIEDVVPVDYSSAHLVSTLTELSNTEFSKTGRSSILNPRKLIGDFNALARQMNEDVTYGNLKGKKFHNAWLLIDDVREYAQKTEGFNTELGQIISDMEYLISIGRTPTLKVYTYDYDDDTVDLPHVDPYTPNYDTDEEYDDRYVCVYNSKVTRHISDDDVASENKSFGNDITTFRLKQGAQPKRFNNGDIWRQACSSNTSVKAFKHFSGTDMSDGPKLIVTG